MRRFFKYALLFLLVVATVLVFVVIYENHSGAKAWDQVRQDLEDAKVELDVQAFVPVMPEPDSNFATTPMIAALFDFEAVPLDPRDPLAGNEFVYADEVNRQRFLGLMVPRGLDGLADWTMGERADLIAIATNLAAGSSFTVPEQGTPAERILAAFAPFAAELAELDAAASRPHAQVPVAFSDDFVENISGRLPLVSEVEGHQKFQSVRASAALAAGKPDEALRAVKTMRQISRTVGSHPTVIGHLVEVACWQMTLSAVWEGLASGEWSEAQLAELQALLQSEELLARAERAMNCELVTLQIASADYMKTAKPQESSDRFGFVGGQASMGGASMLLPDGVWDHNKALGARLMLDYQILPLRERQFNGMPDLDDLLGKTTPRNFLAKMTLPGLGSMNIRSADAQQSLDLAATACALERYNLRQKTYPDTLDALIPVLMTKPPADVCRKGEALSYSKTEQGYVLYSVGANQRDDGGRVSFKARGNRDVESGDWTWAVPMPSE